mgnify:FL=1|tara:strand:+ start:196 stop:408 length:213 start_codon:yes stop_codon:yes gene_type:complete
MERQFKSLRDEMHFYGVQIQKVANDMEYTQPYVSQVLAGRRRNPKITAKAMEMLNERKRDLLRHLEGTHA